MRPGPDVLASFGVSADPVSLPGGEGTAWRAGEAVLKPAGDPRVARWTADLYLDLGPLTACRDAGFRVPRPLRTAAGDWAAQDPLAGQLRSLLAALRPVRLPAQLIHGDLGGNVLLAAGEPPAVIDFSPYWRPAGLALAIAAVDALTWSGADPAILDDLAGL